MKRLEQFNLSQLSSILDSNNHIVNSNDNQEEQLVSEYLSKHLLIARNPPVAQLMSRLEGDTVVMPEMRVMVLTKGHANPIVNLTEHYFEAGQMIFLSQNSIVQPQNYTDNLSGFGLSLTNEILSLAFPTDIPQLMDGHVRDCCFTLTTEEIKQVEDLHTFYITQRIMERLAHKRYLV